jgi:phosphoadenosine phosphosulfate reductase
VYTDTAAEPLMTHTVPVGFRQPALLDAVPDEATAEEILSFALTEFAGQITVTSSFQDTVLVDLALRLDPDVEIAFLDTGVHFPETLVLVDAVESRYGIRVLRLAPSPGAPAPTDGVDQCCYERKVKPLVRHLAHRRAWVTGVRRAESPSRSAAPALSWDDRFGVVKVNPLVTWNDEDVAAYEKERELLVNPLRRSGYGSVGCSPCTILGVGRDGRWAGTGRLECGLHHT